MKTLIIMLFSLCSVTAYADKALEEARVKACKSINADEQKFLAGCAQKKEPLATICAATIRRMAQQYREKAGC